MADKRCENGHFIDENWDICPYCPPRPRESYVARPSRPSDAGRSRVDGNLASVEDRSIRQAERRPDPPIQRTVAVPKLELAPQPSENRFTVGWLVGLNGAARGESFVVRTGRNVIGRSPKSDIVITDEQASAHHADLVYRPDERRFILMDHNSTNGTYVNENEITPRKDLQPRDVVRIGKQKLVFIALCDASFSWEDQELVR